MADSLRYQIDDIKRVLSCQDVADRLAIQSPRRGDAVCPVHDGQSLRIKDDQWYCHGVCKTGGDIINLHQHVTGSTFLDAVKELADWAGIALRLDPAETRRAEQRRQAEDILAVAAVFYEGLYAGSPAQAYAQGRGLAVAEARLGYAPPGWQTLCDELDRQQIDLGQAEAAGLIRKAEKGHYYDLFRDRLIIPLWDRGRCLYITARALNDAKDPATGKRVEIKYCHTALDEPPLYHLNGALKRGSTPILTESITDVLKFSTRHLPAVGAYGVALKEGQRRILERFDVVYVAAHNDAAGSSYADRVAGELGERVRIAPPPPEYNDWDEALTAGAPWQPDEDLTWFIWTLRQIPATTTMVQQKTALRPLLDYLAGLDDAALVAGYLDEMRRHFKWSREIFRGHERQLKERRTARAKASTDAQRVRSDDSGAPINIKPDPEFINPAQAYYDGIVYVARQVTSVRTVPSRYGDEDTYDVYAPAIITSDRRLLHPPELPKNAPPGTVIYLNNEQTLALRKPIEQASDQWSYAGYSAHLRGEAPAVTPHAVYDQLLASIKRYVYHNDPADYVIDVLWAMGTYFHQQFDAYPYLAIHGHKGSGKTTLLHWLNHVAFNASHTVNTSEASLFRWIEATAPTMLIDEQEGLNSRQAAKEDKADLMGILKSGYQKGAIVTRQDPNNPAITQRFSVYSPKAIAAIEHFEDILEDRSLLVYMPKVTQERLAGAKIEPRNTMRHEDFAPLRDTLYLLLMQYSADLQTARGRVRNQYGARFGELVFPLLCLAALIDASRGSGKEVLATLSDALGRQSQKRDERNDLTPEAMLQAAVQLVVADALPLLLGEPKAEAQAIRLDDGRVVMDSIHLADAFASLFPTKKENFFREDWLWKQVSKTEYITRWKPASHTGKTAYRWRHVVQERNERTGEPEETVKQVSVYVVDLTKLD